MSEHNEIPHQHTEPDSWHRHSADEGTPQEEHGATVNPTALGVFFVAMVFGIIFVLLILTAYFNNYTYTFKARQEEGVPLARQVFETETALANSQLNTYGWIDRDAGTVHLPLDAAYQTVIAHYQGADGH
ncbi:MAG: hypothetical protein ACI89L_002408 [Phycisphaerales bacterium]|jgi:hypothetical protein